MCDHEGRECPGKNCRCECMNCQFDDDDEAWYASWDDFPEEDLDTMGVVDEY